MLAAASSHWLVLPQVRRVNLYQEGDSTPYNQLLEQLTLDRCWDECLSRAHYEQRRAAIEQYNKWEPAAVTHDHMRYQTSSQKLET